jgi:hypothetical protein
MVVEPVVEAAAESAEVEIRESPMVEVSEMLGTPVAGTMKGYLFLLVGFV